MPLAVVMPVPALTAAFPAEHDADASENTILKENGIGIQKQLYGSKIISLGFRTNFEFSFIGVIVIQKSPGHHPLNW